MKQFTPHDYQSYCIQKLISQDYTALWLSCGLGKTIITLTAINEIMFNYFSARKVLIIAPKKVSEATWQRELTKWSHLKNLRVSTVLGSKAKRINALAAPAEIYIINRENTQWIVDYYRHDWPFDTVVLDESSSFKNPSAKRVKALMQVGARIKRMIQLTGTPAPKNALDVWSQVYLMDKGARLGESYEECANRFFVPSKQTMTTDRRGVKRMRTTAWGFANEHTERAFYKQLEDICITLKAEDHLKMPQLMVQDRIVVLDKKAQTAYDEMERDLVLEMDETDEVVDAGSAAALRMKLHQICNGSVYDEYRNVVAVHDNKLEALMELIEELGEENVLIFYAFQHDRDRILAELKRNKLTAHKVVKQYKTEQEQNEWNDGQINYLLAHPASCAYGLNIQDGGHHQIWYGLTDSLELYQQAIARLHRQGQSSSTVFVHRLVVERGVDEDIIAGLDCKGDIQEELLQRTKARIDRVKNHSK